PCRRRSDRRLQLPAEAARRTHAGTPAVQSRHHATGDQSGAPTPRKTTEKSATFRDELSGRTGEFYFGTFGENSRGIDRHLLVLSRKDVRRRRQLELRYGLLAITVGLQDLAGLAAEAAATIVELFRVSCLE